MKWFEHDSNALHDAKIEKLIMKFGIEGYGLYFACIEIIASELTSDNITFELEHDAEILAHKFKVDTLRVEEIMKYCVKLGLFQYSVETKRIVCYKLATRLDISMSQNIEFKKMLSNGNFKKLLESNSTREEKKAIVLADNDKALKKWLRDGFLKLNDLHFSNYQKEAIAITGLIKKAKNIAGKGDLQDFLRGMVKAFIEKKRTARTEYWKGAPLLPSALNQRWDQVYELARGEAKEAEEMDDPMYQMFIKGVGK